MIAYLCEVRSTLRNTTHSLETQTEELKQQEEEIQQLATQKEALQKQLAELEESHKYERERSHAVEMNLRQHCEGAQMAYQSLVEWVVIKTLGFPCLIYLLSFIEWSVLYCDGSCDADIIYIV